MIDPFNLIGLLGTAAILSTYALAQAGRVSVHSLGYPLWNALGAGLLLISLTRHFNLAATVIEGFWLLISLYGVVRVLNSRRKNQRSLS